ncbi:hypothetical protein OG871_09995 [Kitasatospora sp. NBC_00374]|uniref:hypothetical protein n=1 Tax=Kitasatospora sp. NBC_00374 TaxID=2975964 RepID=UPI0030E08565
MDPHAPPDGPSPAGARIALKDVRGKQWFTSRTDDFPNLALFRALVGRLHTEYAPG